MQKNKLSFDTLSQNIKITKEKQNNSVVGTSAVEIISDLSEGKDRVIPPHVAAYLCGYQLNTRFMDEAEIETVEADRIRKHKKAVKFAKKKKLEQPELDLTPIDPFVFELSNHEYARNPKEDFITEFKGLPLFKDIVLFFESNADYIKFENEDLYNSHLELIELWAVVEKEHSLLTKDFSLTDFFTAYAMFFGALSHYRFIAEYKLHQNKDLFDLFDNCLSKFNFKQSFFSFVLEESLTMVAGLDEITGYPCNLEYYKELFNHEFKKHYVKISETFQH